MAGYQFIREECYARVRSQGAPTGVAGKARAQGGGKLSAREVVQEAIRAEGAAPHVDQPQPPRCLHGMAAGELLDWCGQLEAQAGEQRTVTKAGVEKRQRADVPILLGAVASFPGPADEQDPAYRAWRDETLAFLRDRYGDRLVSVLEHTDEPHGHVHALIADQGKPVKPLHAGHAAALKAASEGASKKEQSLAYQDAGRAFQDAFYERVAVKVGLARIGPKKRRLTRREWLAEQQASEAIARAQAKTKADAQRVETAKKAVLEEVEKLRTREHAVKADESRINKAKEAVRADARKLDERAAVVRLTESERVRLQRLEAENRHLADDLNIKDNALRALRLKLKNQPT